ncbi:hypothetical protein [Candidatus Methanoprimaticola sp. MG2]|uniref:hypothetical protein n=1 Tax=Candidatus Methanoprimaticola sp. MG2 TaxID=3228838 RepID=UPI0039C6D317
MVTVPTIDQFKDTTVVSVMRKIVDYLIQTLVPGINSDIEKKANTEDLATVATSGSYNDLLNKPNIPEAVVVDQSLNPASTNAVANKPVTEKINSVESTANTANGTANTAKSTADSITTYVGTDPELVG